MARRAPPLGITPEGLISKINDTGKNADAGWQCYHCKLVTPMYGGGVKAGQVDREMPIRASEIRGHLRFWWRIACGPFQSSKDMFDRETKIWGGIGTESPTASKVEVRIKEQFKPEPEAAFEYKPDDKPGNQGKFKTMPSVASWADGYALFSAQGKLSEDKRNIVEAPGKCVKPNNDSSIDFILELRLDTELSQQQRTEVGQSVRWWASFGGVGARTRRGLGAIRVTETTPVSSIEVSKKGCILKTLTSSNNPVEAWKASVGKLKDFRQKLGVGRNPPAADSKSPAGRSLWPEADTIRSLSGQSVERHRTRLVEGDVFPRAAFGLPIVFHFKDVPTIRDRQAQGYSRSNYDPEDMVLEPKDVSPEDKRERMASPLILRPYWNGKSWQPAALLISGWEEALKQPLKFKGHQYQEGSPANWPLNNEARKAMANTISPMKKSNGELRAEDTLSAFMDYFERGQ